MAKKEKTIPKLSGSLIETHCHLDYLKDKPLEELLSLAGEYNIEKLITIAVSPKNLDFVLEISQKYDSVYCTQGIHPHEAKNFNPQVIEAIKKNAASPKVVAIGEIGLDYYYDNSPREKQRDAFEKQLQLASELNLPVVIHSRDADEDTQDILKNFSTTLKRKGVIHSFTSGEKLARFALGEDFFLGFNGIITFKNAQNVRDVLKITPIERVLLETDSPFLTPIPFRGKENAPYYLPLVAEKVAEVKNEKIENVLKQCFENSERLFNL